MDSYDSLDYKASSFKIEEAKMKNYEANSSIIVLSKQDDYIEVYSIEKSQKICSKQFNSTIIHFQLHPKYCNVLSVSLKTSKILLLNIDIDNNKIEEKVEFVSQSFGMSYKTLFSPYKDGTILATLFYDNIRIWDMTNYYHIFNINFDDECTWNSNLEIKWSKSGKYLVFKRYEEKIEVFSLSSQKFKYFIESSSNNFFYEDEKKQIVLFENGFIRIYNIKNKNELYNIKCDVISCKKSIFDYNNSLIYLLSYENIFIYDLEKKKKVLEYKIKNCKNFFLLKNLNNELKLLSKLLIYSKEKNFEILSIFSENNTNKFYPIEEVALNNFWENSIKNLDDNFDFLSFKFNKYQNNEIKPKNYLSIKEIADEVDYLLKNKTLEEKREIVKNNMIIFSENKSIEITYINYIKNIIKDNTNKELLIKYLSFLKNNEAQLIKIYGTSFENFDDEIKQFQLCFNQNILKEKLLYSKDKSEKEQLNFLLNKILMKKDLNEIESLINNEKKILDIFRFNQPISFDNQELYYCQTKLIILNSLKDILKSKNEVSLENMKYCIQSILERKYLDNSNFTNDKTKLIILIILMSSPQEKLKTDYNLNLLDDQDIDVTEEKLNKLGFEYKIINDSYKYKDITIKKCDIELYNLKNLKLKIMEDESNNYEFCNYELFKYAALMDYYKKHFDEDKIREFISTILTSNVIKEAFSFFYRDNIKYPFLDDENNKGKNKALKFVEKYLKYIPLKYDDKSAFTDKFTMETFILLNSKLISTKIKNNRKISMNIKIINKALINGAIVAIIDHEINHNFHNYYYLSQNRKESLKIPRKIDIEDREGGYNIDMILFGKVLSKLTLRQVLYILNEENYKKSLSQYRLDFLQLKDEDCECKGIFKDYAQLNKDLGGLSDYMVVRFKSESSKIPFISISLKKKNDVLGFPNFH